MPSRLFSGSDTLRHPRERLAFVLTLLFAFPAAGAVGFVIHEKIGISEVSLFIVIAMVYVTLARGRLIGSSVMIHEAQYPRVFAIVKRACAALEIPMPLIFAREDYNIPVAALGFGDPYALILSSHWIEIFHDDELAFIVGRQLGHIAAGHTRYLSLLSINGNENALVALIFGGWLRTCELTCDRIGLLVCGSLDAAARAIAVASFHRFGRQVDVKQFAEQGREIARDSVLRFGEWLGAEPYATRRIASMERFSKSLHYQSAEEWFLREASAEPPALAPGAGVTVQRSDCAGWWRRSIAVAIDLIIVTALLGAFFDNEAQATHPIAPASVQAPAKPHAKDAVTEAGGDGAVFEESGTRVRLDGIGITGNTPLARWMRGAAAYFAVGATLALAVLYFILLVALTGQTFGMMIAGLRVVRCDFRPPGFWRTVWRYSLTLLLWPVIVVASMVTHRIMLHDRLSRTRLITTERAMARVFTAPA
ncbi:MAG: RDD family protein [Candidatus Eremiobacteraeota bacterium]|nr:RDD family protein [Candidatus Eremiobacteraeota bacterium]